MRNLNFFGLGLLVFLNSCTSVPPREPASELNYQYHDSFSCMTQTGARGDVKKIEWSPLSGYPVSMASYTDWQKADKKILRPFTSDGCTLSPNGIPTEEQKHNWTDCCVTHDISYWSGGSESDKAAADNGLEKCIADKGYPRIGETYKFFVSKFGGPKSEKTYRWGYGWNYKRPYAPLTSQEQAMIENDFGENLNQLRQNLRATYSQLIKICDETDVGIQNLNSEEEQIFQVLSARVKTPDTIEWARIDKNSSAVKTYLVKIQSCQSPIEFIFTDEGKSPEAKFSGCNNL